MSFSGFFSKNYFWLAIIITLYELFGISLAHIKKRATIREEGILPKASEELASVDRAHMKRGATMREEGILLEASEESAPGDGTCLHYITLL